MNNYPDLCANIDYCFYRKRKINLVKNMLSAILKSKDRINLITVKNKLKNI